ncbi:hypothetical protein SAMN06265784_12025 [Paraburkholderia susongensis]|uniref:Uncharacterized protein n=1 Tax=Paraburkholderia susongensis TaxID=1515439 RepID=A0A1X7M620_9BURK|nr:hypothetical protein SAMN06265784_12025 [Paraburkholderia susongensis]
MSTRTSTAVIRFCVPEISRIWVHVTIVGQDDMGKAHLSHVFLYALGF